MTDDELHELVQKTCRLCDGTISLPSVWDLLDIMGDKITSEQRFRSYGQLLYNPKYDLRLKNYPF